MKVLIISHNPLSVRHSIGKTLLSLFSEFKREELCQLYIHTGTPDRDTCSSYFRVTDKQVLKGVFTRKVKGSMVEPNPNYKPADDVLTRNTYKNAKRREPYMEIFRDVMWSVSPWYNKALKNWIEEEKPTCIFVAIGSSKFLYNMAMRISRDYSLPIVTYVCDDFYTMQTPKAFLGSVWKKSLVKSSKKLFRMSKSIVSICEEMSELYSKEFDRPAYTVMTGTSFEVKTSPLERNEINTIRYFGKISLNRYKSIADIGRAIDSVNSESDKKRGLEVYCEPPEPEILEEFADIASVRFCGYVSGSEFLEKFFSADALLHTEAFDKESVDRVKNSVSTKIADSLSSGIPFFAYGPSEIASIAHLERNSCAVVANDKDELKQKLSILFENKEEVKSTVERALKTAAICHEPKTVSKKLYEILS